MIDELPAAPDPVTDTPAVFSQKAAAFVLAQKAMVPQINVTAANMNSAANGGAFSIPYKFLTSTLNNGSAAGGIISFYPTQILVDIKSSAGALVTNALAAAGAGTSAIKSYLRITNATDPSKWATYSVSSYALSAGGLYGVYNVTLVDRTSSTPFANNDAVILSITPNGDKGDQGVAGASSNLILVGSYTVSTAVAAINFLSLFTSTYDKYIIEIQGMTASAAATLRMRMAQAGVSQAVAAYAHQYSSSAGMSTGNGSFQLTPANVASTANLALSCSIEVRNVNAASPSSITANGGVFTDMSGSCYPMDTYGLYSGTAACSGFTLFMSTGNITAGIVRVFGVKNT